MTTPTPPETPPRVREVVTDCGLRTFFYRVDSDSFKVAESCSKTGESGVDLGREYLSLFEHDSLLRQARAEARREAFSEAEKYCDAKGLVLAASHFCYRSKYPLDADHSHHTEDADGCPECAKQSVEEGLFAPIAESPSREI